MPSVRLQIFGGSMPIYLKRFRNRIGRLARCGAPNDLTTQIEPIDPKFPQAAANHDLSTNYS
jgi:hypothetical protein